MKFSVKVSFSRLVLVLNSVSQSFSILHVVHIDLEALEESPLQVEPVNR